MYRLSVDFSHDLIHEATMYLFLGVLSSSFGSAFSSIWLPPQQEDLQPLQSSHSPAILFGKMFPKKWEHLQLNNIGGISPRLSHLASLRAIHLSGRSQTYPEMNHCKQEYEFCRRSFPGPEGEVNSTHFTHHSS